MPSPAACAAGRSLLFGLGKLHRRSGDREQAQEHLTTAMAMYREIGMTDWPEQVEGELRQVG